MIQKYDRGSYQLLIGDKSIDLFDYFRVDELHGLTREAAEVFPDSDDSAYIYGMCNYHPLDKNLSMLYKPYLFLNKMRLNGTYKDVTGMMHEYLHLAKILAKSDITDSQEESMVSWIEKEINWVIENGVVGIMEQPSTHYM
jgi:hypothetical protein